MQNGAIKQTLQGINGRFSSIQVTSSTVGHAITAGHHFKRVKRSDSVPAENQSEDKVRC